MPRPVGAIGGTKLKILAIVYRNGIQGTPSYGYDICMTLRKQLHCYLDADGLRNVYHHLKDLTVRGLIEKDGDWPVPNAPRRQFYSITDNGRQLKQKFEKYLRLLESMNA